MDLIDVGLEVSRLPFNIYTRRSRADSVHVYIRIYYIIFVYIYIRVRLSRHLRVCGCAVVAGGRGGGHDRRDDRGDGQHGTQEGDTHPLFTPSSASTFTHPLAKCACFIAMVIPHIPNHTYLRPPLTLSLLSASRAPSRPRSCVLAWGLWRRLITCREGGTRRSSHSASPSST